MLGKIAAQKLIKRIKWREELPFEEVGPENLSRTVSILESIENKTMM